MPVGEHGRRTRPRSRCRVLHPRPRSRRVARHLLRHHRTRSERRPYPRGPRPPRPCPTHPQRARRPADRRPGHARRPRPRPGQSLRRRTVHSGRKGHPRDRRYPREGRLLDERQLHSMNTSAPPSLRPRVPAQVYLLAAVIFCLGTSEFMIAGILEPLSADLGVTIPQAGLLITGFAVGMIVGAPAMTLLTLTLPRRATMIVMIIGFSALHIL